MRSAERSLLADYARFAGSRLPLSLALMFAGALAEGFGILMLAPLIAIAAGSGNVPAFFSGFARLGSALPTGRGFELALGLFIAAMAARALLLYARDSLAGRLTTRYDATLKLRAAATLATRGWTFAAGIGQSGLQSLLLTDIPRASQAVYQAHAAAVCIALLTVQALVATALSVKMAAIAGAIIAAGLLTSRLWFRRARTSGLAVSAGAERSSAATGRLHAGLKAALAQGTVPQFLHELGHSLGALADDLIGCSEDLARARWLASFAGAVAAAMLLFAGYRLLQLPLPILLTILIVLARMLAPAQQLQQALQQFFTFAPSFEVIEKRLGAITTQIPDPEAAAEPLAWRRLELDRIRYFHRPGLGLDRASLSLRAADWIGISGPSGAGKTTLIDLAAGLLEPQDGTVTVDGEPLAAVLGGWRAGLAYVPQQGAIFDDSVRMNLVAEGASADDATLWAVLDLVGLADRVRGFDQALDTNVGDRGSRLSGGERQRLVIARALLRRPRLLILDEATSALDELAETQLLSTLRALDPRPAAILVAHRPSTLSLCDRVLDMADGQLRPR